MLTCEDKILNTRESRLIYSLNKKVTYDIVTYVSNIYRCPIYAISLVIVCIFLLVVVSINCYYYYTKHWLKKTFYHISRSFKRENYGEYRREYENIDTKVCEKKICKQKLKQYRELL